MIQKAKSLPADEVFLDLEDAVAPDAKADARAAATAARASALASGATASSRSRNTSSAGSAFAFWIILALLPGTDRHVRRGR